MQLIKSSLQRSLGLFPLGYRTEYTASFTLNVHEALQFLQAATTKLAPFALLPERQLINCKGRDSGTLGSWDTPTSQLSIEDELLWISVSKAMDLGIGHCDGCAQTVFSGLSRGNAIFVVKHNDSKDILSLANSGLDDQSTLTNWRLGLEYLQNRVISHYLGATPTVLDRIYFEYDFTKATLSLFASAIGQARRSLPPLTRCNVWPQLVNLLRSFDVNLEQDFTHRLRAFE